MRRIDRAKTVPCPKCGAKMGEDCFNKMLQETGGGYHIARLKATHPTGWPGPGHNHHEDEDCSLFCPARLWDEALAKNEQFYILTNDLRAEVAALRDEVTTLRADNERMNGLVKMSQAGFQRWREMFRTWRGRAEQAEANYQFMVNKAADEKLDGYRRLGAAAVAAEERADVLLKALLVLTKDKCPACPDNHNDRCWLWAIIKGEPGPEYDGAVASMIQESKHEG